MKNNSETKGTLYLMPVPLGDNPAMEVLSPLVRKHMLTTDYFVVENSKTARKFIKAIAPEKKQSELHLFELNKHTKLSDIQSFITPILQGENLGLLSDAGCPGVADPGALIVELAHENNIRVVPLVGPSSILLSLMGSGMNGQSFTFNGYLPIDKSEKKTMLKNLEKWSFERNQTQIFIETPYRNNQLLEDITQLLHPNTLLCIACDLTLDSEFLKTKPLSFWKKNKPDLHKRPCIFLLHKK